MQLQIAVGDKLLDLRIAKQVCAVHLYLLLVDLAKQAILWLQMLTSLSCGVNRKSVKLMTKLRSCCSLKEKIK